MPSKLRAIAGKVKNFASQNKGKLLLGAGALAVGGLAYAGYRGIKSMGAKKKRRITVARVRNKRRLVQEKTRLLRAQRSYNKQVELQ